MLDFQQIEGLMDVGSIGSGGLIMVGRATPGVGRGWNGIGCIDETGAWVYMIQSKVMGWGSGVYIVVHLFSKEKRKKQSIPGFKV